ncbi:hypothetical protein D0B54_22190 [Solimonas sp. K1W22B-7]|uniref:iron chaperone n=1 Tax=Solimonas sp. K1W22B-7 TaxID=2303331 RepID=UPI000E32E54D|nr:DUF1801 domain-containing protein [Solimonas sp. K1W22B-7]AXQ31224.1 hypothetical protein D0B54_22190 [Solimonas sp. K1W22B-7]
MTASNIDEYIAAFPADVQAILQNIRATIRKAAPQATERISYQMPAFFQDGVLAYYGAFRHHIGFYPPVRGDAGLVRDAAAYAGEKGNLRFPFDQAIPYDLIRRIVEARLAGKKKPKVSRPAP